MSKKKSQKNKQNTDKILGGAAIGLFALALILSGFIYSNMVAKVRTETISRTPSAILASATNDKESVLLPVAYYDQRADECVNMYTTSLRSQLNARQFEWGKCDYNNREIERGLVEFNLGGDYLPVAKGGQILSNRGIDMGRWFSTVEGKSQSYVGNLELIVDNANQRITYENEEFYPLDDVEFSQGDFVNTDKHNHLFTMSFALPFNVFASGEESFEVVADDDTFVFVGDKLVIDMGGIHSATSGRFTINEAGEIYSEVLDEELAYSGVNVAKGENTIVRIFHADRDSRESVLKFELAGMNLSLTEIKFADADTDGVQIAYDPTMPSEVAPLGVSSVIRPDAGEGYVVVLAAGAVLVVAVTVFFVVAIRYVIRTKE
ncbi:hypothetical protein IKF34_03030 [Candidatus Saccharibacteria bacterium]|nr:hypothetical protein [Candidatus Saccharibacteria bacterium]